MLWRSMKSGCVVLFAVAMTCVLFQEIRGQDTTQNLTYSRGQTVMPAYDGWHRNADGTIDMWFGYLNQNWQEELDIPIGPNNNVEPQPLGPDAGQPTHFLPRHNRWQFAVRVPNDWGSKEVVWTLTSRGRTFRAHGTLKPDYFQDDFGMQRESGGSPPLEGNTPPVLHVEGDKQRTVKAGQPISLTASATDDGIPKPTRGRTGRDANTGEGRVAFGLRLAWYVYRGAGAVAFDPPQFKVWEDQRGGSPWAPGWEPPPVPPGNTWVVQVTFRDPGAYVLRAQASDGLWYTTETVTLHVTP